MFIRELMTVINSALTPNDRLSTAVMWMEQSCHSCVLIAENNVPVGIVTERDIVAIFAKALKKKTLENLTLNEVMTTDLVCVKESTSLYDGLYLAWDKKVRHLPVVGDNGHLKGLVTQTDMISCYARFFEKQFELESANQKLRLLSYEDALLGIGNRRAMEAGLIFTEASAKRTQTAYAIALLDVDYFKKYNDHYGHQEGDEALVRMTNIMKSSLRDSDQLYRYGGEEFLLLMPDTDIDAALVGAERIRLAIDGLKDPHAKSPYHYITVSVGVASKQAGNWEFLLKCADSALYDAKAQGRNRSCKFE